MAANKAQLKDKNDDIVYPLTVADAVVDSDSVSLQTRVDDGVFTAPGTVGTPSPWVQYADLIWSGIFDKIYPVGSIFMSATLTTAADVATALGGGTWVAWGAGRVPVGVDTNDVDFDTVEETGGEKAHTLTKNEMPKHNHLFPYYNYTVGGGGGANGLPYNITTTTYVGQDTAGMKDAGGDGAHNNLQPYITCYMYKRTA